MRWLGFLCGSLLAAAALLVLAGGPSFLAQPDGLVSALVPGQDGNAPAPRTARWDARLPTGTPDSEARVYADARSPGPGPAAVPDAGESGAAGSGAAAHRVGHAPRQAAEDGVAGGSMGGPKAEPRVLEEAGSDGAPATVAGDDAAGAGATDMPPPPETAPDPEPPGPDPAPPPTGETLAAGSGPAPPEEDGWQTLWTPFASEASARGFAAHLASRTDVSFRVMRFGVGDYRVAFRHEDEAARRAALAEIAEAAGLAPESLP